MALTPFNGELDSPASGLVPFSGNLDDEQPEGIVGRVKQGLARAKDYDQAIASGINEGIANTIAGAGTFIQAPAANALSGIAGAAALADRGITAAANYVSPGSAKLNEGIQETARSASQFAADERSKNVDSNIVAKAGQGLQEFGREHARFAQDQNKRFNPELLRQQQGMADTEGFVGALEGIKDNPMAFTHMLARSAPDMMIGAGIAKGAASGIAAAGGSAARQVAGASTAGIVSEAASSANQGREGVYQQVTEMPLDRLAASPRFNEILEQTGDAAKAREVLANELADQVPLLSAAGTALGSVITNKLFGGDTSARMIAGVQRTTGKDVLKNIGQESTEEGFQGVPEDLAQHGAVVQADPSKKFDLGKTLAENMAAGAAMGGGGSIVSYARDNMPARQAPQLPDTGPLSRSANIALATQATQASEVLGAPAEGSQFANSEPMAVDAQPASLAGPDRVAAIGAEEARVTSRLSELAAGGYGPAFDGERSDLQGRAQELAGERESITASWPKATTGAKTSFSTESGNRLAATYALMSAGDLNTSHDESLKPSKTYPAALQPRERDRAASEMQVSGIAQRLDPARLGESADAGTGAPIVGADGLVESGNARTIALKRVYQSNPQKADEYKQFLRDNAARFGLTPEAIDAVQNPVLVRVRETPVNRIEFARQANASAVAQMSSSETAKADAARLDTMDDLRPTEDGDFVTSRDFIRRFISRLPGTEQAGMIDAGGQLSQTGYTRIRNAVLAKAYGDSPVLTRLVESLDDNLRNVGRALMQAAPAVAKVRQDVNEGALFDADITPDLLTAVEELSSIKDSGRSIADYLAQGDMIGGQSSSESRELLQFLSDNMRRPRKIAEFIQRYTEALRAAGNPNQGSLLGATQAPSKRDIINAAWERANEAAGQGGHPQGNQGAGQETVGQRDGTQGDRGGAQGNAGEAQSEWVAFPPETGTLGIPRANMPQVKGEHRGALIQYLEGKGITYETRETPASEIKPTQAEFSTKKAERWGEVRDGADRSVLVSSDGHILDGHHQWIAALAAGENVKAIAFNAPIKELLTEVHQFPSAQRSEGAANGVGQAKAREDFQAALADLGAILRDFAQVARMVPENTPDLMPTLVKLFESGIQVVGFNMKALVAHVKKAAKANETTKRIWNKISDAIYLKAARQAVDNVMSGKVQSVPSGQLDMFAAPPSPAQPDLFAQPAAVDAVKATKAPIRPANTIVIDQVEYDADAPNFGLPAAPITLKDGDPLLVETYLKPADSTVVFQGETVTRAEMRKSIEDGYFSAATPAPGSRKPIAYVMGGGGASGKGFVKKHLIKTGSINETGAVSLDPDEVKPDIPEYSAIVAAGDSRAAAVTHEESSDIAKRIKARAIAGRYDIVLDVTLGDQKKGEKYLQELKDAGYEVRLFGVTVNPESAVIRAMNRAQKTGRYVPISALLHAHRGFNGAFEAYAKIADEAVLFDNTTERQEIARAKGGNLVVSNREAYNGVAERSQINERARTLREISSGSVENARRDERERTAGSQKEDGRPAGRVVGEGQTGAEGTRDAGSSLRRPGVGDEFGNSQSRSEGGKSQEGSLNEHGRPGSQRPEGTEPGTVQQPAAQREAERVPGRADGRNQDGGAQPATGDRQGARDDREHAGDGAGRNPQDGRRAGTRRSVRRDAGIPAGRDIPVKTGRNYAFGDSDLTYEGSWLVKASQNVEALELLKQLEKDGRQATRDEQAKLAKFIGWGASDLANSLFGDKLTKQLKAISDYDDAMAMFERAGKDSLYRGGRVNGFYKAVDTGYYAAFNVLNAKADGKLSYQDPAIETITRKQVEAAKPDMAAKKWAELRDRIKAALTPDEWNEASRSTQYAHYTSKPVVKAMWSALERMGFKGGAILEPGAGIGVFPGLMASGMANNSIYTGIEFDSITGGILKQLFPDERILVESFIDSKLPKNFYDVAAGNPPFNNTAILADPAYKKYAFALHDYFFAKSIDSVKPGGLVMFVTSRYTMDKLNDKARAYLAERADLVGAIRLPQTAFKKNAGTDVVTDVLFLRKKVDGEIFEHAQPWAKSVPMKVGSKSFPVNEYFHAHPEMVLGKPSDKGKMANSPEPQYTVEAIDGDIDTLFEKAAASLPANIYKAERGSAAEAAAVRELDFNPKAKKEGNFYVTDAGVLMQLEGGVGVRAEEKHQKNAALLKDFVGLRDALKQAHYDQLNDGDWEKSLAALQKSYRAFVKKHGQVNQFTEMKRTVKVDDPDTGETIDDERSYKRFPLLNKIDDDPDYTSVMALESINEETGKISESAFLTDRVLGKPAQQEISTPADALLAVLNDIGHVDIDAIADRLGMENTEVVDALGAMVYEDPAAGWVMADEYLSGNVKKKLAAAQEAVKSDHRFTRNIDALLAVQPVPVAPADITVAIGMNWIPEATYEQFLYEKTGVRAKVNYNERTGQWSVVASSSTGTLAATQEWGTPRRSADDILLAALTGAPIRITETVKESGGGSKTVFLADATEAANQKLAQMREAFRDWMWQDAGRTDKLVALYNDTFNTIVPRAFDGRHLTLPGTSQKWKVFDHVKRGAWRIIQSGNTYLAHAVGSGKTFEMIISAMEQKRLGLIKKPMMVVPNHMLQQFAREWIDLYPAARLMVADEKNFHTENRRRFSSRVAMSDLDGVIITHSAFKLLDLDPAFKQKMIEQELDYLRAAFVEAGGEEGKKSRDPKIKQIESKIEKMEQKLAAAMSGAGKDKNVRFDEMGVDMVYVDEAHEFRKLAFATQRQVKGIDSSGSDRAFDLWMKTRWLEEKKPGRSLVMASGTPVTNTLAELYSVQRFMAPQVLEERGIDEFDAWASMFGQEHTEIEADASGKYAPVTRFSKFVNVPELTQMFREFADVLTSDHLAAMLGDKRPKVQDGSRKIVITPQTSDYRSFKQELASRLEISRAWRPSRDEPNNPDPVIKIIGDGRLASIDMRFIDPSLPSDPDSKLNRMADEVIRVFKETANNEYREKSTKDKDDNEVLGAWEKVKGATQIVFSDLGFGAGVAENRGFNARAWFEKRLRDAGVPPAQVAFMSDHKKSQAKLKLFKDINAGRVRVVVGSSKNMGTGVNAQQRLIALHHLDTPWYPADLEQREGRIVRQGNKNPLVQLYAYSTKGSYDAVMWQMLASKQRFIDQALSGDSSVRSIDDLSESSQFQIATAMTSDDERAIQLAGVRAEIEKLQRLYRAHEEQRARMKQEYDWAGETIRINTQNMQDAKQAAGKVQNLGGDNFTAKADGRTFDVRKEFGEALMARFKDYSDKLGEAPVKIGEISGFDIMAMGRTGQGQGYRSVVFVDLPEPVALTEAATADPVGVALKATNALTNLSRLPAQMQQKIDEAAAKRNALEARITAPFPMAEMLSDKIRESQDLETAMLADQNKLTGLEREQELEDAWQARTGAITPMLSRNLAYNEADALPNETAGNRTLDGAELAALRRAAARIERPQDGVYLRVTEDGRAVATGPKGTKVPETFRRFAKDNNLVFTAGRIVPDYRGTGITATNMDIGITKKSAPMPIIYRESGALYFGERGAVDDRTGKTTFSRGNGAGMALRDLSAVADRVSKRLKNLPKVHVLESPAALSTKDPVQKALRDFIRKAGAWEDAEGATHEGEIYLFASGLADEARAEHVLAVHEVTHYGLRGAIGKDLDAALQNVWMMNAKVRKAAAALKQRNGLQSNIEATEEVMADMTPGDLVKLQGWRRVLKAVRDWLGRAGFDKLAARVDSLLKSGMDEQAQADLLVADLVTAARDWVKSGKGRPYMEGTRLADGSLAEDVAAQEKWLTREAKARGYASIDEMAEKNYKAFENLAKLWREKHPADALLSRALNSGARQNVSEESPIKVDGKWTVGEVPKVGDKFIVYRFGNATGDLAGRNAGNAWAVANYIMSQEDYFKPNNGDMGTHVFAYEVEITKPFGKYEGITRGIGERKLASGAPVGRVQDKGSVAYSFERDGAWKAKTLGSVSLDQLYSAIKQRTGGEYKNFDGTGTIMGAEIINGEFSKTLSGSEGTDTPRFSRNINSQTANQPTVAQRAEEIISKPVATWRPIDTVARMVTTTFRIDRLTSATYDGIGYLLDYITPEAVKAGVVSDYGVPESVLDQRTMMQGRMRVQLRKSGELIDKLATLTRAESRVAYEWMNNSDPQARAYFEAQLPEESVKVMEEVKDMIDKLSQEAVALGQLDPEAFKRNRFEYLRRSYIKHTTELTKSETAGRKRAIAILGDQYKGRGMTDAVDMAKFKNVAPEWWGRKLKDGQADKGLKGEKFIRLERRAPIGEGVGDLEPAAGPGETNPQKKGRLLEVAYWPAGEALPAKYSTWDQSGTWEVRDTKGGKLVVWRDFTKAERVAMGEIDEARYAIAKSLHGMIHDVETGRYLEWLAQRYAKKPGEAIDGEIVDASERMRDTFAPGEWVQVPETKIPGTSVLKYGKLADLYLPGPIWNDVRQTVGFRFKPLGETYAAILGAWKTAKTALSPAVHTNNVMANFVMADWHDVSASHILKALRIILGASQRDGKGIIGRTGNAAARAGIVDSEAAREVINRFLDSGANLGSWVTAELQKDQLEPLLAALEKEIGTVGESAGTMASVSTVLQLFKAKEYRQAAAQAAITAKNGAPGQFVVGEAKSLIDLYEAEDQVFRLAAWLKAKEDGAADSVAGNLARRSFLDYHINAPWIQAMRNTTFPFISFTYRAVPMMLEVAAKKPHKIMKLAMMAAAVNALGYLLSGGDEDDERRLLPEEKAGRIFGGSTDLFGLLDKKIDVSVGPKLIRMPWNDAHGAPVFLDIRRFVPVGDIFDTGQTHSAVPLLPFAVPGGPLALVSELVANKSQFTGRPITLETDTPAEKAEKVADHLYKAFAPNIVALPGTHAWTGVSNAATGRTDSFGREQSTAQAAASAFGIKLGSYPADVLELNAQRETQAKMMEIDRNISQLKREYQRSGITDEEFMARVEAQQAKKTRIMEDFQRRAGE